MRNQQSKDKMKRLITLWEDDRASVEQMALRRSLHHLTPFSYSCYLLVDRDRV